MLGLERRGPRGLRRFLTEESNHFAGNGKAVLREMPGTPRRFRFAHFSQMPVTFWPRASCLMARIKFRKMGGTKLSTRLR